MGRIRDQIIPLQTITDWAEGGQYGVDIPTEDYISGLLLRLSGNVVKLGSTAGTVLDDGSISVIDKIEVVVDGRSIKRISGRALHFYNAFTDGVRPYYLNIPDGAADTDPIVAELFVPMAPESKNPAPYYFPAGRFTSIRLNITWCTDLEATLLAGHADTATSTTIQCEVSVVRASHDIMDQQAVTPVFEQHERTVNLPGTNSDFQVELTKGAGIFYTGLTILTTDAGLRDGDVINKASFRYGEDRYRIKNIPEETLNHLWRKKTGLAALTGVYHLDLTPDKVVTSAARADETVKVVFDATIGSGTTNFIIVEHKLVNQG